MRTRRRLGSVERTGGTSARSANLTSVQRAAPAAVVASALAADAVGAHRLSFYLLLGAIVLLSVATLERYGQLLEFPPAPPQLMVARFQALLGVVALALALVAAAARAPVLGDSAVPPIGLSALVGALGLLTLQAIARLAK